MDPIGGILVPRRDREEQDVESDLERDLTLLQEMSRVCQKILASSYSLSLPIKNVLEAWTDFTLMISSIFMEGDHPFNQQHNPDPHWDPNVLLPAGEVPFGIPELSFTRTRPWKVPPCEEASAFFEHLAEIGIYLKRELGTKPKQIKSLFRDLPENLLFGSAMDLTHWINTTNNEILVLRAAASELKGKLRQKQLIQDSIRNLSRLISEIENPFIRVEKRGINWDKLQVRFAKRYKRLRARGVKPRREPRKHR
jgi:hypothetical protein